MWLKKTSKYINTIDIEELWQTRKNCSKLSNIPQFPKSRSHVTQMLREGDRKHIQPSTHNRPTGPDRLTSDFRSSHRSESHLTDWCKNICKQCFHQNFTWSVRKYDVERSQRVNQNNNWNVHRVFDYFHGATFLWRSLPAKEGKKSTYPKCYNVTSRWHE